MKNFIDLCDREIIQLPQLNESINDSAMFKAVFMAGSPGAGKSYVVKKITDGTVEPRIVNTDKFVEFIAKQQNFDLSQIGAFRKLFLERVKELTTTQFTHYINGMLPLWLDGTSKDQVATFRRMNLIESFGYDVYMVWVDTSLETSLERARKRTRAVPEEFIRQSYEIISKNRDFFQAKLGNKMIVVKNDEGELNDAAVLSAYRKASKFYHSPLENIIGKEIQDQLRSSGEKYLDPTVMSLSEIRSKLNIWYK